MKKSLISIIVPVFNSEKQLERCINSLIRQTYRNIEIIMIDDGSTDGSGIICNKFASIDERCKVYHINNGGVVKARNFALDIAEGEYITFVDSDDFVFEDYIESLYKVLIEKNVLMSTCSYFEIQSDKVKRIKEKYVSGNVQLISVNHWYDFNNTYAHKTVWAALYSRTLIGETRFREGFYVAEDSLFFAEMLYKVDKLAFLNEKKYIYVLYDKSSSHGYYDEKKYTEILAIKKIKNIFNEYSKFTKNSIDAWCCLMCVKGIRMLMQQNETESCIYKNLSTEAKNNIISLLKSTMSLKTKILCCGFCFCPKISWLIYKMRK